MGEALALAQLLFGALFLLYWGLAVFALYLAFSKPKTAKRRAAYIALVVAVFGSWPGSNAYETWQYNRYKEAAYAHFKKMCAEKAGEKIYRTVENVDGIFIAKPRSRATDAELRDQFWMGDPYGHSDYEAEHPAGTYLYDRSGKTISDKVFTPIKGYVFVEMANPEYGKKNGVAPYLRYTLKRVDVRNRYEELESRIVAVAEPVHELKSRYALTWEDISTPNDRMYWVAGGTFTVVDMSTKETVAERVGYVIDPHLGRMTQGRVIWLHVNQIPSAFCPPFENDFHKNKEFVAKVLKATSGAAHGK